MTLVKNRVVLTKKNREILSMLDAKGLIKLNSQVVIEETKTGVKTIKVQFDGINQFIHSKYAPEKEAERLIGSFDGSSVKHVLFIGAGMGYHIQEFVKQYPDGKFSIYEPNIEVLNIFLQNVDLSATSMRGLQHIFAGTEDVDLQVEIQKILNLSNGMLQLIILPAYEKLYKTQVDMATGIMLETLKNKKLYLAVNLFNQKRWTVNSIKNFPTVARTPNIMHDFNKSDFCGKPAIIVAAGPSLTDEIENLRMIKENESAYIFSVGSAINTLIEAGIYPHATCAYDPSGDQWKVLQKVKDKGIQDIPLIFGSSIGFEALERYEGPKFHMITSPDTVSPQLLDTTQSIDIVWDAPTIAAITFQLLSKLGCNPIILVGQNLAYKDDERYATGISYDFIDNKLSEQEKNDSITIQDVNGYDIQTDESFNIMRKQLEFFIKKYSEIEVINATKLGAHIEGTKFFNLDDVIKSRLKSNIVNINWSSMCNSYDKQFIKKRIEILSVEAKSVQTQIQNVIEELKGIDDKLQKRLVNKLEHNFAEFDKSFSKLKRNPFYIGFIEPMLIVQNSRLSEESSSIRFQRDILKKAEVILQLFGQFIKEVELHYEFVKPYFEEMKEQLLIDEEDVIND